MLLFLDFSSSFCYAMKINVVHKETRLSVNILSSQKIWQVKELISKSLNLNIGFRGTATTDKKVGEINDNNDEKNVGGSTTEHDYDEKRKRQQFMLLYNGGSLNDDCTVSEVGLVSGSTLRCRYVPTTPYVLKIHVKFLLKDIEIHDEISTENSTVGDLRTHIQNTLGIPVSVFNLQQVSEKRDLFDNRELSYYGIKYGDTLILDVWKGTKELLISALNDDNSHTLTNVPSYHDNPILNRYYLKVALFIAAHHDFVNLAAQVLQRGGR